MKNDSISDDKKALRVVIRYRVGARVQKEVAKKGGLDPTTMSQFASGNRYPRPANMARLATALDCSVPMLKEAIAKVLAVSHSGGDSEALKKVLDQHFMGEEGDTTNMRVDQIRDPTLKSLVNNWMKANSELLSYLASTPPSRKD